MATAESTAPAAGARPRPLDRDVPPPSDMTLDSHDSAPPDGATPPRKKQKRNKPTLSCDCCVERKTKVRPPSGESRRRSR